MGHDEVVDTITTGEVRIAATVIEESGGVDDSVEAYATTLDELANLLLEDASLEQLLEHVLELTARAIESTAAVSVTIVGDDGGYTTVASSSDDAVHIDQLQYDLGEGPCVDALETGREHLLEDLTASGPWPRFRERVMEHGFRSVLAIPLLAGGVTVGALNIFADAPTGFSQTDIDLARRIAAPAATTVANARAYRRVTRLTEQLQEAMSSRAVIEQAKGILVAQRGCSADEAFDVLREVSQGTNRKLRDVAAAIVESKGRRGV